MQIVIDIDEELYNYMQTEEYNEHLDKRFDYQIRFSIKNGTPLRENCEGCELCEPRLAAQWNPDIACVNEGWTKWFLDMAKRYKAESEDKE